MGIQRYVLRGLRGNRQRYLLAVVAALLTVAMMVMAGILVRSLQQDIAQDVTADVGMDLIVTRDLSTTPTDPFFEPGGPTQVLAATPGIARVLPLWATPTVVLAHRNAGEQLTAAVASHYGVHPDHDLGRVRALQGSAVAPPGGTVLSKDLALSLRVSVGDVVQVAIVRLSNLSLDLSQGRIDLAQLPTIDPANVTLVNLTVSGVISTQGRFLPGVSSYLYQDLETVQRLYESTNVTALLAVTPPQSYDLRNSADPSEAVLRTGTQVAQRLGPGFSVLTPRATLLAIAGQASGSFNLVVYLTAAFFPGVGGLIIASMLTLSVEERSHDLAVMRLLGARRRAMASVVLAELGAILLPATALGALLGWALLQGLERLWPRLLPISELVVDPTQVLGQLAIASAVTLLFALGPTRQAFRTSPADALFRTRARLRVRLVRSEQFDLRLVLGALLLFGGLIWGTVAVPYLLAFHFNAAFGPLMIGSDLLMLVLLSIGALALAPRLQEWLLRLARPAAPKVATLTRANLRRNTRRNLSTTLIFLLVVTMVVDFSVFSAAYTDNGARTLTFGIGADLRVSALDRLDGRMVDFVADEPDVLSVSAVSAPAEVIISDLVSYRFGPVRAFAPDSAFARTVALQQDHLTEGSVGDVASLGPGEVVLSRAVADSLGAHRGDTIVLRTTSAKSFVAVVAVVRTLPGYPFDFLEQPILAQTSGVLVAPSTYLTLTNGSGGALPLRDLFVDLRSGVPAATVANAIQRSWGTTPGLVVVRTDEVIDAADAAAQEFQRVTLAIFALLLLVAVFSLVANLQAAVRERAYELGVLNAIGLRRAAIARSMLLEGAAIGAGALAIGMLIGIGVAFLLLFSFNIYLPIDFRYILPLKDLGILALSTLAAALIGSALAVRTVARMPLTSQMRRIG